MPVVDARTGLPRGTAATVTIHLSPAEWGLVAAMLAEREACGFRAEPAELVGELVRAALAMRAR